MTGLYVVLGIVVFVGVLLLCPVSLYVSFKESLVLKGKFIFFPFTIYPQKEKVDAKQHKNKKKTDNNVKENKIKGIIKEKGLGGFLKIVKEIVYVAVIVIKRLFYHMEVDDLLLDMEICSEDAAKTAIDYGKICSAVYPVLSLVLQNNYKKKYRVSIRPGFSADNPKVVFEMDIHIKLFYIVINAIYALFKITKTYIKN